MIRLDYGRWIYDLVNANIRHIGTAMVVCAALEWRHWADVKNGYVDVLIAIAGGVLIPTTGAFFRDRGLPPIVEDKPAAVNVTAAPGSNVTVNVPEPQSNPATIEP